MASNENLSHAEIWDDSALVDSWNDAVEEYKHYHSIHARGERVEDILQMCEDKASVVGKEAHYEEDQVNGQKNDPRAKMELSQETPSQSHTVDGGSKVEKSQQSVSNQASGGKSSKGSALPQHLIGQVHDEGLKNLLMSWYYAGYYTGLHEGQQQGVASKDA